MKNKEVRVQGTLKHIIQHNQEAFSYEFESPDIKSWLPGESSRLFMWLGDKEVGKKFSYATTVAEGRILFTTRIKADASPYKQQLSQLAPGSVVELTMPGGDFNLRRDSRPVVILSNGVGIAATRALVRAYVETAKGIPELVQINVDRTGSVYKNEFDSWMLETDFSSFYTQGRKEFYLTLDGQVDRLEGQNPYYYIVGSNDFIMGCGEHLLNKGISEDSIITDDHVSLHMPACTCGKQSYCGCDHDPVEVMDLTGKFVLPVL